MWFSKKEIPIAQYRIGGRKSRMLYFFEKRKGQEVSLPDILKEFKDIAEPMRVIRYLRADGHEIVNSTKYVGKIQHSFYTYKGYTPVIDNL